MGTRCAAAMGRRGDVAARAAVVALVVARCCMPHARAAPVVHADMEVLEKLAPAWYQFNGTDTWRRGRDCDSMALVRCDDDGHVIALNASLSNNYVVAPQGFKIYLVDNAFELPFPMAITALKHLTLLSIMGSGLSGSLPAALFTMPNLKHLDLTNNKLSGRIPDAVGLATCLQTMDLSSNYLHGSLPASMGNLSHLTRLTLTDINLNGSLPAALFTIPTLEHLVITKTLISGSIPNEVGLATGLHTLDLSDNWLTGSLPASLGNLSSLLHLNLESNGFSGSIPEAIGNLKHLQKLNLGRQKLSGPIPESIGALTNLQEMLLFQTRLSGTIPATIARLTALTSLYLCDNRLAGTIPAGISRLTNLRELYFANNQLVGPLPAINRMAHLQYLHAEENYLKATANPLPQCPTTSSTPCNDTSGCPSFHVHKNCLTSEPIGCNYDMQHSCLTTRVVFCREFQAQRLDSKCRSFCGAQFLTPPCSGHGVCSIVPDPSSDLPVCKDEHPPSFCNPNEGRAECTCDEGYTPGTAADTCVPQGISSDLSGFQPLYNLLLPQLLPLAVLLLLLLLLLALLPRRINLRPTLPPPRYVFSNRAFAARQAASGV